MPIYAVPKPHSLDFRLVNDHSASKHSLNSMIDHDSVTGFPLDSLAQYGHILAALHARNVDLAGACPITAWKSDIAEAYQLCPMHPAWQIRQGVCINGEIYVQLQAPSLLRSTVLFPG